MISPHTPPGTKIICIDAAERPNPRPDLIRWDGHLDGLTAGEIYTVRDFRVCPFLGRVEVRLHEIVRELDDSGESGFNLRRFRRADLPSCLTELLKPVNLPREELV